METSQTSRRSSGSPSAQKPRKTFPCSCTYRCKGRLKQLTRATYLKHAQFREIDAQREAEVEGEAEEGEAIALPLENEDPDESFLPESNRTTKVLIPNIMSITFSLTIGIQRTFRSSQW